MVNSPFERISRINFLAFRELKAVSLHTFVMIFSQVEGWEDTVKIIVSCVTHNPPYKCHPFILVDRPNKCRYGVYTDYLPKGKSKFAVMSGVGIKILTEECFAQSLRIRRYLDANPFERTYILVIYSLLLFELILLLMESVIIAR